MIEVERFELENGLKVLVHRDESSPMAALNLLYDVGARDEREGRTGFAHLFEHLMFGGSVNIPSYDSPLQIAGGENNAFTTNDITNYYITLPAANLETGFWLESDRMLSLAFSEKSLEVQRQVVIEEFRQRYLNQPYGDIWLLLRPLVYQEHAYKWPTIGQDIAHIEEAKMEDVRAFFEKHYNPGNAILCVTGDVTKDEVERLANKWFGPIPAGEKYVRNLPQEPKQTEARRLTVQRKVPVDGLFIAFHSCDRRDPAYYATDLISDVLSRGKSSRFYNNLVKEQRLFSEVEAFVTGSMDPGLLVVSGKLVKGVSMEDAEAAVWRELEKIKEELVDDRELQKVKNKVESAMVFGEMSILNKAMNLATQELVGRAEDINVESERYQQVTAEEIREQAQQILRKENSSTLCYMATA